MPAWSPTDGDQALRTYVVLVPTYSAPGARDLPRRLKTLAVRARSCMPR
jgi:hypothetical protein